MFLVVLRHPASLMASTIRQPECNRVNLTMWIESRRRLFADDIPRLKNVAVVHYEQLMQGNVIGMSLCLAEPFLRL